jgi:hypothetical protein
MNEQVRIYLGPYGALGRLPATDMNKTAFSLPWLSSAPQLSADGSLQTALLAQLTNVANLATSPETVP